MPLRWTRHTVVLSSFTLAGAGVAAFFVPGQLITLFGETAINEAEALVQLYGACLLGFGFANWHVRSSPVGGIYGRAIVTGNLVHFIGGTGLLTGLILGGETSPGLLAFGIAYALFGIAFGAMLLSSGIGPGRNQPTSEAD